MHSTGFVRLEDVHNPKRLERWATASKLDRAELCPASLVLPEGPKTEETKAQIWGNSAHKYIETGRYPDEPAWVAKGLRDKVETSGFVREEWYPESGVHEIKGWLRGQEAGDCAAYFGDPETIRLKIDYYGTRAGLPWVDDLKTGRFPDPPTGLQVASSAVWAWRMSKSDGVFGSVTHWPRYPKAALPTRQWHYFDPEELDIVAKRLQTLRDEVVEGPDVRLETGEQCRYCNCVCEAGAEWRSGQMN